MSAFLGPIHYWVYNKILVGENIQKEVLEFAKNRGINVDSIKSKAYEKYGEPDYSNLEDVIDEGNIHGWLQGRIDSLEYRLASIVTDILKENIKIEEIKEVFKSNGKEVFENIEDKSLSADGLFKVIFDNLVEGMPCDRVNLVEEESDEKVVWITTTCVHKRFWDAVGGDVNNYYILKDGWIEGFVSSSPKNFVYEREDNKNYIKKA
ncbi:Uncharacterised protein [Sarcina ventriculi]|uniref:Uncharacterized protein n=2 Tax=Sarcina TaxID=1266 RepID=A0ACD1BD63_9CLOT|nr:MULTISPECIES: hypothetical protein [Sarcina]MDO4402908.1 hypothetical protein [Clostridiaceae bacterium]MBU5321910.1 hypothetical protein [Sarcina ventriculi]MDD7372912.1 hypothetical protein [Sarcina ventriculi]QPJ85484.1 hypothetical protein HH195_05945 [Sarcina sp. JB2]CUN42888.1 Uncharacterised protein [Sarcina ventriculi]